MSNEIEKLPLYQSTMDALERAKHVTTDGGEYWLAREICPVLGYTDWGNFEGVMQKASDALRTNGIDPSHHIGGTTTMMAFGKGAQRKVEDFFVSRPACYLIAMNGQSSKPEIAAAQSYFVVQTRRQEIEDEDEKRLRLREKVSQAHRVVSGGSSGSRRAQSHAGGLSRRSRSGPLWNVFEGPKGQQRTWGKRAIV
jgi:DNA-damage-inducible protein D